MKKIYVNELKNYLGDEIQDFFYLQDIQYTDDGGNRWQMCLFCDRTGKSSGKAWSQNMNPEWDHYCGHVVKITGKVEIFRDIYGLNIFEVQKAAEQQYDILDFLVSIDEEEREHLMRRFMELAGKVVFEPYRQLLTHAYGKRERFAKLCEIPADRKFFYAYRGGWLESTVKTTELSIHLASMCTDMQRCVFHNAPPVNQDLLITGALLHDIGKLSAIQTGVEARTTRRGYLVGSVNDSMITISVLNNNLPKEKRIQDITDLLHVVAAAEGEEAEVRPQIAEGCILAEAKHILQRLNAFYSVFASYDFEHPNMPGREFVYSKFFERMLMRGDKHV